MRILFVVPGNGGGSSMVFARREIDSLTALGVEAETFFLGSRTSPLIIFREFLRLRAAIRRFRPHVLHAQFGTVTGAVCALAGAQSMMITYRGNDLNPTSFDPWLRGVVGRFLSQLASLRASRIVCVSSELRSKLWWRRQNATVIPSGVNTQIFFPRPKSEARANLGLDPQERIVVFNIGGNPGLKGLDLARASVKAAERRAGPIHLFTLNGDVPPTTVPYVMNAGDCLLVTSESEGSPNVVKEALACNLPVVSVDVGDVRERLQGVHPSAITPRDPESIGEAIAHILDLHVRSNGWENAQSISLESTASQLLFVYHTALGLPPGSSLPGISPSSARAPGRNTPP